MKEESLTPAKGCMERGFDMRLSAGLAALAGDHNEDKVDRGLTPALGVSAYTECQTFLVSIGFVTCCAVLM